MRQAFYTNQSSHLDALAGGGKTLRGREVHGAALVPAVAAYLAQQAAPRAWEESRLSASCALLELLLNCRSNCHLLAAVPDV